ncbi:MAG: hypothetical protein K2J78_07200 [Muribaculaceae bacterium]|nr:hypothetical protein [Muribaculaceae bacterium]
MTVEELENIIRHSEVSLVRPAPIRIFILDDRIEIHSPGNLPRGLAIGDIENGTSMPRNEQLFYHANFLLPYSGAGTGILRAMDEGLDIKFKNDEQTKEFVITIPRKVSDKPASSSEEPVKELVNISDEPKKNQKKEENNEVDPKSNQVGDSSNDKSNQADEKSNEVDQKSNQVEELSNSKSNQVRQRAKVTKKQKDILNFCSVPRSAQEIMDRIGIDNQTNNRKRYIQALIDMGYLQPLYPESMTASNQKYVKVKK